MSCGPGIIRKLDQTVVNRIAAGEVVQRPANALKELLENCLDAKANQIQVTVKQGGLKVLQIQDNGTGIRKEDLGIVCERFTTSKLKEFSDLQSISTYGFRGEALASITHVAHLSITTRTKGDKCAWKLSYCDSIPKGDPKPSAGNQGTLISVEDLFYNIPTRRKALKNPAEEHAKIYEVVSRYAIHNSTVGFTLKKQGDSSTELRTPLNSTVVDNIRIVFGPTVAKELLTAECKDDSLKFSAKAHVTNANYSVKKFTFVLFINHRLVESTALRKAIEQIYTAYLPKHGHPFVYLSVSIAPENIDVNVHPTKYEVHFLHQESIVEKIQSCIDTTLIGCNESRTYFTQSLLPGAAAAAESDKKLVNNFKQDKIYDKHTVRTDSKEQKLTKFLQKTDSPSLGRDSTMVDITHVGGNSKLGEESMEVERREIKLTSILSLLSNVDKVCHSRLKEIISNHSFIGCVTTELALIQHSTELYIVNIHQLCKELFYQLLMKNFGNFGVLKLSNPTNAASLALLALNQEESGWSESDGEKESLASVVQDVLISKCHMLDDYYSFKVDEEGNVCTLPYILDSYVPCMSGLPMYLLRLSTEVEWDSETDCFETFARETANFYAGFEIEEDESGAEDKDTVSGWRWTVEHVLFPAMKRYLKPTQTMSRDTTFLEVANLPDLYKVFERC